MMSKVSGWITWFLLLAGNGLIVFLWLIFGLAGSSTQSPAGRSMIFGTGLGVIFPLLVSIYFMLKERFGVGIIWLALIMPFVFAFCIFIDLIINPDGYIS